MAYKLGRTTANLLLKGGKLLFVGLEQRLRCKHLLNLRLAKIAAGSSWDRLVLTRMPRQADLKDEE